MNVMSLYNSLEVEYVDAAKNAMLARLNILNQLVRFPSSGAESWFQWEFAFSPWSSKWDFKKRRPYDLEVRDSNGNIIDKLEIKCCTDQNFSVVSKWLYPSLGTEKKTVQQLRQDRQDVKVLFLGIIAIQNQFSGLDQTVFAVPPYWVSIGYHNPRWIVGILKRR